MSRRCCPRCFGHRWLQDFVGEKSTGRGTCSFCGSRNQPTLDVSELSSPFENLLKLYKPLVPGETMYDHEEPLDVGEFLIDLAQEDWEVFSDELYAAGKADDLFDRAVQAGWDDDSGDPLPGARELYTRRPSIFHTSLAETWEEFCRDVIGKPTMSLRRKFHELMPDDLWRSELKFPKGTILYRARLGFADGEEGHERPWSGRRIGARPKPRAGRANAASRRVLYCAEEERTAIAEVGPWLGALVSVCKVRTRRELSLLDPSTLTVTPNPFVDEFPLYEVEFSSLLRAFADELSRPLRRDDKPADYRPCQKLSQYVEKSGFDGIKYPSAVAPDGTNVVLFNTRVGEILDSWLVEVQQVDVQYEPR